MTLDLVRKWFTDRSTIGELSVDGEFQCFIEEPTYRPPGEAKVPGRTAIPCGEYPVTITNSPRFSQLLGKPTDLPLIDPVPGFSGVRIHPGNLPSDTEGCLLPGMSHAIDRVVDSRRAFVDLFAKLQGASEPISLVVRLATPSVINP